MSITGPFVVFRLDQQRYALPLPVVERVVRAVEVTPLPHAPPIVLGIVNVHGEVVPVLNVRKRFLLPDRAVRPADAFLLVRTAARTVAVVVDAADGIVDRPATAAAGAGADSARDYFPGVLRLDDGLVLIHDVDRFLSPAEARALGEAIEDASRA